MYGIPESGKFLLVHGIRKILHVESGIPGVESRIQDYWIPLPGAKHQRILSQKAGLARPH